MRRIVQIVGGLVIVLLAGAGGGFGLLVGMGYFVCGQDIKCIGDRLTVTQSSAAAPTPSSTQKASGCVDREAAEDVLARINLMVGNEPRDRLDAFRALWAAEGGDGCLSVGDSVNLICHALDGYGSWGSPEDCRALH